MAVDKDSIVLDIGLRVSKAENHHIDDKEQTIEEIIVGFVKFTKNNKRIKRKRAIIALNQIYSLYRRMDFHPDKKGLIKKYENDIKEIIKLERGKAKWMYGFGRLKKFLRTVPS